MKIRLNINYLLPMAFFVLTLQNAQCFITWNISNITQYIGLSVLLLGCTRTLFNMPVKERMRLLSRFVLCAVLLCIGLLKQDLENLKIAYLCISYILLAYIAIVPDSFLSSLKEYRKIANAVLIAFFVATILSLLNGSSITTYASEGILVRYGFNGGMEHRNYYAYSMLGCFILYDLDKAIFGKKKIAMLVICFILMTISNSRSVLIVFVIYFIVANYRIWRISGISKRVTLLLFVLAMILVGIPSYQLVVSHSETFAFRVNGLNNYIDYLAGDWEHIIFGNATLAFANTGMTYDQNIRSVIGWDGSVELVILNIMIKAGLLGIIAFIILFMNFFKKIRKMRWNLIESRTYAIVISFMLSALVEAYVGTLNSGYSPLCYTLLATLPYLQADGKFPLKLKIRKHCYMK